MKIILDVMSGDNAPRELVKGAAMAQDEVKATYILVGEKAQILQIAEEEHLNLERMTIVDTKTVITMEDDPLLVVRGKQDSSMAVALKLLADGKGDVLVSAGNTGALFTGATLIVRKIKGFLRAAISTELPLANPVVLLDSGANVTVEPDQLVQFAEIGSAYMKRMHHMPNPRVGLLNNGTESHKGTELQKSAYQLLKEDTNINFIGNVEANSAMNGACDVLVTDGFTGNIFLKAVEGFGKFLFKKIKEVMLTNTFTKMSAVSLKKPLKSMKASLDPRERGGSPILGISKPVIKAHGSSDAKAFKNAVAQAVLYAESGIIYDLVDVANECAERRKKLQEERHRQEMQADWQGK